MSGTEVPSETACTAKGDCLEACEELAAIFRALGHPARLAIVKKLALTNEACCGEIVNHLPLAQSTVSQHLQVLKDAGLLTCDTRGRNCHYVLNWEMISRAERCSEDFWARLNTARPIEAAGAAAVSEED
jgi:ArsR family transcriptional regulator